MPKITSHILLATYLLSCAQPLPLLQNPGTVALTDRSHTIALSPDQKLALTWSIHGIRDSTCAIVTGERRAATAHIVEANPMYLRLKSTSWQNLEDIPDTYLGVRNIRVIPRDPR